MAVPRLLGDEHGECVLRHLTLGRRARLDSLRVGPRPAQGGLGGAVIDHDVRLRDEPDAADRDEAGIAGTCADDEDLSRGRHQRADGPKYPALVRAVMFGRVTRTRMRRQAPSRRVLFEA
jgi:hypothetical protein